MYIPTGPDEKCHSELQCGWTIARRFSGSEAWHRGDWLTEQLLFKSGRAFDSTSCKLELTFEPYADGLIVVIIHCFDHGYPIICVV
jgi:hypothetical protein